MRIVLNHVSNCLFSVFGVAPGVTVTFLPVLLVFNITDIANYPRAASASLCPPFRRAMGAFFYYI